MRFCLNLFCIFSTQYEVRLKSECMEGSLAVPAKLRQYYSEPIVGLIDKTAPKVFGFPQPTINLYPGDPLTVEFDEDL